MCKKCATESAEQRDKRNRRNALTMHEKHALKAENASSSLDQESSIQYQEPKLISIEQLSAADQKLLHNFVNTMQNFATISVACAMNNFHLLKLLKGNAKYLKNLMITEIKEMLIAQVFTVVSAYSLHGGQYVYCGNINNFPHYVQEFATRLLHCPSSLDMLVVRRHYADRTAFRDFIVHSKKVTQALLWLKENNIFYHDIEIADDIFNPYPKNDLLIDQLP
ncbi:hypothetical protein C2G38_2191363 [Gigaspora rosea]|uniref:DUF6570 domain-containing protein n=1 Tax=Gigaspora rosea TaxID=44941 RepID=A0A397V0B4_9GLOM|nr:hypothetical protein C2G38_2191363 [Gigaspora rosea]